MFHDLVKDKNSLNEILNFDKFINENVRDITFKMFSKEKIFLNEKITKETFEKAHIKYLNLNMTFHCKFQIKKNLFDYFVFIELTIKNFAQNFGNDFLEIFESN
jgi:hypothetical protein